MVERRRRKSNGSPEWIRLGKLLKHRRAELDARYDGHGGRTTFAEDVSINLRRLTDLENNVRETFKPVLLQDEIAPAYRVTYESIRSVLDEDGDLAPLPDSPPHKPPHSLAPVPTSPEGIHHLIPRAGGIEYPPEARREMEPVIAEIERALIGAAMADARRRGIRLQAVLDELNSKDAPWVPTGAEVFGAGTPEAEDWDGLRSDEMLRGSPASAWELVQGVATLKFHREVRERTGLPECG